MTFSLTTSSVFIAALATLLPTGIQGSSRPPCKKILNVGVPNFSLVLLFTLKLVDRLSV